MQSAGELISVGRHRNPKIMNIDIFYKTYQGDYSFLAHSLKSVKKHGQGFRQVVIVTDHGQKEALLELITPLKLPAVQVFELESKLDIYKAIKLPKPLRKLKKKLIKITGRTRHKRFISDTVGVGYEIQKAAKCDWIQWSDADAVFQVDSDMVLTGPLHAEQLFEGDKPIWFCRPWEHFGPKHTKYWKPGSLWFYNLEDSQHSYMASIGSLITRELAIKFIEYVNDTYGCSLYRLYTNINYPSLSEYELLGLYADQYELEKNYVFYNPVTNRKALPPLKAFWSWGGITDEVKSEIEHLEKGPSEGSRGK